MLAVDNRMGQCSADIPSEDAQGEAASVLEERERLHGHGPALTNRVRDSSVVKCLSFLQAVHYQTRTCCAKVEKRDGEADGPRQATSNNWASIRHKLTYHNEYGSGR